MSFKSIKGELFLIQLDNWDAFIKAIDDDFHKKKEFQFFHPLDGKIAHHRHYVYFPAIGNTFMMVGQMRHPTDSACVRIVHDSVNYKESYLVIYDYLRSFDDADVMAKMLENAFNEAMKDEGVEMKLVRWDTKGKNVMWIADSETTYNIHYHLSQGINVSKLGYEDLVEHHKKANTRNEKRKEERAKKKKRRIEDFIKKGDHQQVMKFLRESLKNCKRSRTVSMPFRLLKDKGVTGNISFSVIMQQMPELKGRVSETRYKYWTSIKISNYNNNDTYKKLAEKLDRIIK